MKRTHEPLHFRKTSKKAFALIYVPHVRDTFKCTSIVDNKVSEKEPEASWSKTTCTAKLLKPTCAWDVTAREQLYNDEDQAVTKRFIDYLYINRHETVGKVLHDSRMRIMLRGKNRRYETPVWAFPFNNIRTGLQEQ